VYPKEPVGCAQHGAARRLQRLPGGTKFAGHRRVSSARADWLNHHRWQAYPNFQDATINFGTGVTLGPPLFGSSSPSGPRRVRRVVTADINIEDDGGSNWAALCLKIPVNTPITITMVIGTVAGNIHTFTLNNAVLPQPIFDRSGSARILRFSGIKMAPTSATAKNPLVYVRT
jgi:hypothetical protein